MSKADKLLDAMRLNPAGDWTMADVQRVCFQLGWQCLAPSGGSHWKVTAPGSATILTVPAKRPIKPVYIRKLITMVDEVSNG
jgi:predicted RNA binding protein YcfA (HicA-like mRNA interferase family)